MKTLEIGKFYVTDMWPGIILRYLGEYHNIHAHRFINLQGTMFYELSYTYRLSGIRPFTGGKVANLLLGIEDA